MEMRQLVMDVSVSPLTSVKNELRTFILERPEYHSIVYLNYGRSEKEKIRVPALLYDKLLMEFKSKHCITKDMRVKAYYELMRKVTYKSRSKATTVI